MESGPLAPKRQKTGSRCTSGRQVYGYFHEYLDGCEWDVKVPDWLFAQSCIAIVLLSGVRKRTTKGLQSYFKTALRSV